MIAKRRMNLKKPQKGQTSRLDADKKMQRDTRGSQQPQRYFQTDESNFSSVTGETLEMIRNALRTLQSTAIPPTEHAKSKTCSQ